MQATTPIPLPALNWLMNIVDFIMKIFYEGRQQSESKTRWVTIISKTSRENLRETSQDKIIWESIWTIANSVYHQDKVTTSEIQWKKKAILTSFACWLKCLLFQHFKIASKVVPHVFFQTDIKNGFKTMRQISLGNLGLQSQQRQVHEGSKYVPSSSWLQQEFGT